MRVRLLDSLVRPWVISVLDTDFVSRVTFNSAADESLFVRFLLICDLLGAASGWLDITPNFARAVVLRFADVLLDIS